MLPAYSIQLSAENGAEPLGAGPAARKWEETSPGALGVRSGINRATAFTIEHMFLLVNPDYGHLFH